MEKGGTPITMRTITKSLFGSPGRSAMSAPALVTFASAIAALVVLALSATAAQSAERHNGNTIALSGGKTWLKLDKGTAAALSDAGVKVEATGAAEGPTAKRPYFAFPIVGGKVDKYPLGGKIVHLGGFLQRGLREGGGETLRDRPGPSRPERQGCRNGAAHSVAQAGCSGGRQGQFRADRAKGR